jgi:hypothetical protein
MKQIYIKVKYQDYLSYYEKYGHNRIDKWYKIQAYDVNKVKSLSDIAGKIYEEEIFEGTTCEYKLEKLPYGYLIYFKSKSYHEYRFDIINEPNTKIYHLSFSDSDKSFSDYDYEELTNRKEAIDVFSRIIWILKDVNNKIDVGEYCIGGTNSESKNIIYEYMMRFVSGWEKRKTDIYESGWALYFKIK